MISLDSFIKLNQSIAEVTLGSIKKVERASTDTRAILEGDLFVALTGENFDGNKYLLEAIKKGAKGCLFKNTEENLENVKELFDDYPEVFFIGTACTETFFQELAHSHLLEWRSLGNKKTIGITGSNGKTTTKELMAFVLEKIFPEKVLYTEGNLNNHLGLPMTLLRLKSDHDICILEMGTNHPGEISFLCKIGDPQAGIITSIGQSHLEFFENEANVFKEKRSLYDYVKAKSGYFSVDSDNKYLNQLEDDEKLSKVSFNIDKINYEGQKLIFKEYGNEILCKELIGKHNFKNLAVVISLLLNLFPEKQQEIFESANTVKLPENNRSQFITHGNQVFFLDAYNANPSSMTAALESFQNYLSENNLEIKDSLFVLGDMNELGEKSGKYHQEIGITLDAMKVTNAIFVGRFAKDYASGFKSESKSYNSTEELKKDWIESSKGFTSVFLKGSRTLQLEQLMTLLVT